MENTGRGVVDRFVSEFIYFFHIINGCENQCIAFMANTFYFSLYGQRDWWIGRHDHGRSRQRILKAFFVTLKALTSVFRKVEILIYYIAEVASNTFNGTRGTGRFTVRTRGTGKAATPFFKIVV